MGELESMFALPALIVGGAVVVVWGVVLLVRCAGRVLHVASGRRGLGRWWR